MADIANLNESEWFDPVEIANEALAIGRELGLRVSHLKLQKLLYIAHGVHLAAFGSGLVRGGFQAWQFGPVSPELYQVGKRYGSFDIDGDLGDGRRPSNADSKLERARAVLKAVLRHYAGSTALQLVELTHRPGTPWHQVVEAAGGIPWARRIEDERIRQFYVGEAS